MVIEVIRGAQYTDPNLPGYRSVVGPYDFPRFYQVDSQPTLFGENGPSSAAGDASALTGVRSRTGLLPYVMPRPPRLAGWRASVGVATPIDGGVPVAGLVSHPGSEQLTADERDRLAERGPAGAGVTHRGVLVPYRHAAEEDEPVRG